MMKTKTFIFIAGLHRSGTSLLHEIIKSHPRISGFSGTGVPKDEGQHLQSVYKTAMAFGGPGKFVFDSRSYMDETHSLATPENAKIIFEQWRRHFDLSCDYLIEKSPPNIVRTRFLQQQFPNSQFIVILRHPLALAYATQKWSRTSIESLLDHSLSAYEIVLDDMKALRSVFVLRYEELVENTPKVVADLFGHIGLAPVTIPQQIRRDLNQKYFSMWEADRNRQRGGIFNTIPQQLESRANTFGYSLREYERLSAPPWLGSDPQLAGSNRQKSGLGSLGTFLLHRLKYLLGRR